MFSLENYLHRLINFYNSQKNRVSGDFTKKSEVMHKFLRLDFLKTARFSFL